MLCAIPGQDSQMTKLLLTFCLIILAVGSYGQFNRNLRTIDKSDTSSLQEADGTFVKFKPADFPGGMAMFYKYISRKMKFPKEAKSQKIRGKVFVQFVIDSTGNVKKESVKVKQSLLESCDKEAVRLIKNSPTWIPAVNLETNKTIESLYIIPILFYSKID